MWTIRLRTMSHNMDEMDGMDEMDEMDGLG